jgi:hypothetical protein
VFIPTWALNNMDNRIRENEVMIAFMGYSLYHIANIFNLD